MNGSKPQNGSEAGDSTESETVPLTPQEDTVVENPTSDTDIHEPKVSIAAAVRKITSPTICSGLRRELQGVDVTAENAQSMWPSNATIFVGK